jgi:hypothetical protein
LANRRAVAAPNPEDVPVTNATIYLFSVRAASVQVFSSGGPSAMCEFFAATSLA